MVRRAVCLVDLVGHRVQRVEHIHPHAALEAGARQLPQAPLHIPLLRHLLRAHCHMQEAVHALTGERRGRRCQLRLLHCQLVRHRQVFADHANGKQLYTA